MISHIYVYHHPFHSSTSSISCVGTRRDHRRGEGDKSGGDKEPRAKNVGGKRKPLNASRRVTPLLSLPAGRSINSLRLPPLSDPTTLPRLPFSIRHALFRLRHPHDLRLITNHPPRMAKGPSEATSPTTATPPSAALKRTTSSTQNMKSQKSILGFFQKSSPSTPSAAKSREPASSPAERASAQRGAGSAKSVAKKKSVPQFTQDLPPVPSSDLVVPEEEDDSVPVGIGFCNC